MSPGSVAGRVVPTASIYGGTGPGDIALRLRIHSRVVAGVGYAAALLLLFASTSIPWLQLVFPFWVLLVSINIVVLSYRHAD